MNFSMGVMISHINNFFLGMSRLRKFSIRCVWIFCSVFLTKIDRCWNSEAKTRVVIPVSDTHTHNPHASLFSTAHSELWERALVIIICIFTPATSRSCIGAHTISSDQGYYLWRCAQSHAGLIAGINYSERESKYNKTIIIDGRESA